jgi:hypothetical protein
MVTRDIPIRTNAETISRLEIQLISRYPLRRHHVVTTKEHMWLTLLVTPA